MLCIVREEFVLCFRSRVHSRVPHLNPEPEMVSRVPPAVPPLRGDTSEITGVSSDL